MPFFLDGTYLIHFQHSGWPSFMFFLLFNLESSRHVHIVKHIFQVEGIFFLFKLPWYFFNFLFLFFLGLDRSYFLFFLASPSSLSSPLLLMGSISQPHHGNLTIIDIFHPAALRITFNSALKDILLIQKLFPVIHVLLSNITNFLVNLHDHRPRVNYFLFLQITNFKIHLFILDGLLTDLYFRVENDRDRG